MEWARRLKTYRRQMGYKQTSAAEALGVSQATLSKWERGLYEPTVAAKSKIYKAIAKDDDELIIARQRFIVENSGDRTGLLEPDSLRANVLSASTRELFGLHPSAAEGFDLGQATTERHVAVAEKLFAEKTLHDKDVIRVSVPAYMFYQHVGRWIESVYHVVPIHSSSGTYSHLMATTSVLDKPPEIWRKEYTIHSVFGEETFRY